jgi:hypothetical protein
MYTGFYRSNDSGACGIAQIASSDAACRDRPQSPGVTSREGFRIIHSIFAPRRVMSQECPGVFYFLAIMNGFDQRGYAEKPRFFGASGKRKQKPTSSSVVCCEENRNSCDIRIGMEYSRKTTSLDGIHIILLLHYFSRVVKLQSWLHLKAIILPYDSNFLNPAEPPRTSHTRHKDKKPWNTLKQTPSRLPWIDIAN